MKFAVVVFLALTVLFSTPAEAKTRYHNEGRKPDRIVYVIIPTPCPSDAVVCVRLP